MTTFFPKVIEVDFGMAKATLTIANESSLTFRISEKNGEKTDEGETVQLQLTPLRPDLYLLNWKEKSGVTVVQVHDYDTEKVYSVWTKPDGTLIQVNGTLKVIKSAD